MKYNPLQIANDMYSGVEWSVSIVEILHTSPLKVAEDVVKDQLESQDYISLHVH